MFESSCLTPQLYPLVNKFYRTEKARGKAKGNETVWVTRESNVIVAAARIADIGSHDFLTGVQVARDFQGQGIARQLLQTLLVAQQKPLHTFPYDHLQEFYRKLGFEAVEEQALPIPLKMRFTRYRGQGRAISAMVFRPVG